jgi:hypothetical protein
MLGQVQTKHFLCPNPTPMHTQFPTGSANKWNTIPMIDNQHFIVKKIKFFKNIVELFKFKFLEFQELSNMYAKYTSCYAFIIATNGLGWECDSQQFWQISVQF